MTDEEKIDTVSAFSTGGGGYNFENRVQASFVILMVSSGFAPCLSNWPIETIELQAAYKGYKTDDVVVTVRNPLSGSIERLLCQVKRQIAITRSNNDFREVIASAWMDFSNSDIFSRESDRITLITGPMNRTDSEVREILEGARTSASHDEFFVKIQSNLYSRNKRNKLGVIREHLESASNNQPVDEEDFWLFLRRFHLLSFDLDIESGVNLSLIHSILGQYGIQDVQSIWARAVEFVKTFNQNAGTITISQIPPDFLELFSRPTPIPMPDIPLEQSEPEFDWGQVQITTEIAIAALVGSWNEKIEHDRNIISSLAQEAYEDYIIKLRDGLAAISQLNYENGIWFLNNRHTIFSELGSRLFDDHLIQMKKAVLETLEEVDPKFDLPPEERHAAAIYGKTLSYSRNIRHGLAGGLAIIGSHPNLLRNCTDPLKTNLAREVVATLLSSTNWEAWASLDPLLPLLAEAAPDEFIKSIESHDKLLKDLFDQESSGVFGSTYITGILWGLENLAWSPDFLSRSCVTLGHLASYDPGGRHGNRPSRSLVSILLPWHPNTVADVDKRVAAMKSLTIEYPDVSWGVLKQLLPNRTTVSTSTHKPAWRDFSIPSEASQIGAKEYWIQVASVGEMLLGIADSDVPRVCELVELYGDLPDASRKELRGLLEELSKASIDQNDSFAIWSAISNFVYRNRRFSRSKWAMRETSLAELEEIGILFQPSDPSILYRRLFADRTLDFQYEDESWEDFHTCLDDERLKAIDHLYSATGFEGVERFSLSTESPKAVGDVLARISHDYKDYEHIRELLESSDRPKLEFVSAYLWRRYLDPSSNLIKKLLEQGWSTEAVAMLLRILPFSLDVWELVEQFIGEDEDQYWKYVQVWPTPKEDDLDYAIRKLLEYGRPLAAINCTYRKFGQGQTIDAKLTVDALLAVGSTDEDADQMSSYYIKELIRHIQTRDDISEEDILRVEWLYFPQFDFEKGLSPALLEYKIAEDPQIFCDLISMVFKSKKDDAPEKINEKQRRLATNAYRVIQAWSIPPGLSRDKSFDGDAFIQWLESMVEISEASGHLKVALSQFGQVLIYVPEDNTGLWIDATVAQVLNRREMEALLRGYSVALFNARGVRSVDPTGRPEDELAKQYFARADNAESLGFVRLADAMRKMAKGYEDDADRIRREHGE